MLVNQPVRPRPVKTRSRAGCKYCRDKRKKCSEEHPQCLRCVQAGVTCIYEPIKKRKRRALVKAVTRESVESDDLNSPTGTTDQQTSPDTNILTPPDVGQTNVDLIFSPPSPTDNFFATSIDDAILPICEDFDGSHDYDMVYVDSEASAGDFATVTEIGRCQKGDVDFQLSSTSMNGSVHSVEDSFSPSLDMSWYEPSWSACSSPLMNLFPPSFYNVPDCPEDTGLFDHYSKVMLPTMGFKEGAGNPYEQHIIPLSHRSSAVRNAIYALASAHREYAGLENTEGSAGFRERAVAGLSAIIEEGDGFEEALATIVLLLQFDLLMQRSLPTITRNHLQGAWHIISAIPSPKSPSVEFFEQVFRYFDVLNALAHDSTTVFAASGSSPPPISFDGIDPVLGMAEDLWPTLHRLSELATMKRELQAAMATGQSSKFAVLRTEYQTTYKAIEHALETWNPVLPPGFDLVNRVVDGPEDATEAELANIRWITSTALAYRQGALVYLYSAISEYPSSHDLVQRHTQAALWHCAASVSHGAAGLTILWPLFFSACHAICSRDRSLVRQAFTAFGSKKGTVNTEKPWNVVQDVWRRIDMRAYGKEQVGAEAYPDLWKQIAADMGVGLVFG